MHTLSGYSLILTDMYTHPHNQDNRKFSSLAQTSLLLLCSQLPSLLPALGNYWSTVSLYISFSLEFRISGITEGNLSCLPAFAQQDVFEVHSCLCVYQYFASFHCWIVLGCTDMPQLVYPFIFLWVFGLFLDWGFMKQHSYISLFLWIHAFISLG